MLYVVQAPAAANGRAVVVGHVSHVIWCLLGTLLNPLQQWYTQAGKLIAVCTQEGVVRAAPPSGPPSKAAVEAKL